MPIGLHPTMRQSPHSGALNTADNLV
jgi:hypothetical protein